MIEKWGIECGDQIPQKEGDNAEEKHVRLDDRLSLEYDENEHNRNDYGSEKRL
jgi:hypothetical protein